MSHVKMIGDLLVVESSNQNDLLAAEWHDCWMMAWLNGMMEWNEDWMAWLIQIFSCPWCFPIFNMFYHRLQQINKKINSPIRLNDGKSGFTVDSSVWKLKMSHPSVPPFIICYSREIRISGHALIIHCWWDAAREERSRSLKPRTHNTLQGCGARGVGRGYFTKKPLWQKNVQ